MRNESLTGPSLWVMPWREEGHSRFTVHRLGELDKWLVYCGDKPYYATVFPSQEAAEAAAVRAAA